MENLLKKFENNELDSKSFDEIEKELKDVWTDEMIIEEGDYDKKVLVNRLIKLQTIIKHRDEFDEEIQYADEQGIPTLLVKYELENEDGDMRWYFHFLDDDFKLSFIELNRDNSDLGE